MLHPTGTVNLLVNLTILALHSVRKVMFIFIMGIIALLVLLAVAFQTKDLPVHPSDPDSPRLEDYYDLTGERAVSFYKEGKSISYDWYVLGKQQLASAPERTRAAAPQIYSQVLSDSSAIADSSVIFYSLASSKVRIMAPEIYSQSLSDIKVISEKGSSAFIFAMQKTRAFAQNLPLRQIEQANTAIGRYSQINANSQIRSLLF